MWPLLLRPPVPRFGSSSDFSGVDFVISPKSDTERNRVAGVTGLNCRIPISALEHGDRIALFEGHDRFFPRRPSARARHPQTAGAPPGAHDQRPDVRHGHLEEPLDSRADLRLRGLRVHTERVLFARLIGRRGLLGDHRPQDRVLLIRHLWPPPPPPPPPRPLPSPFRTPRPALVAPPPPPPPRGSRPPS